MTSLEKALAAPLTLLIALLTALVFTASPAAAAPAPRGPVIVPATAKFHCPYKYLCVHVYWQKYRHWTWIEYYDCFLQWLPPHTYPTWYINNQTPGTVATFYWGDGSWNTPGAFSKGPAPRGADIGVIPC